MNTVDWSPVYQALITLFVGALTTAGTIALAYLSKRFSWQTAAIQDTAFDSALVKSLLIAGSRILPMIEKEGYKSPDVHAELLREALPILAAKFPDALKGVSLTSDIHDPQNVVKLIDALGRSLPNAMLQLAASPASPDAPSSSVLPVVAVPLEK